MRIGLVVPHIFMQRDILPHVIFSPGRLALDLAEGLQDLGAEVTLYTPGPVTTKAANSVADLSYFEQELAGRGDTYVDLLKKHPFTFITLARQVQAQLLANAFADANAGRLDIVHIYMNEEDTALPFARFCNAPVVFTHHDPFNFSVRYKNVFPAYAQCNWLSVSLAQRQGMPPDTNWVGNIYHGLRKDQFAPNYQPVGNYVAYMGRIIQSKGVHLAIEAVRHYNRSARQPLTLKIAGKHYAGKKDTYWHEVIEPALADPHIQYAGYLQDTQGKQDFLGNAQALLMPSLFDEPFGMVGIEALACATPIIGLAAGAIPELLRAGKTGLLADRTADAHGMALALARQLRQVSGLDRQACRLSFEHRFTLDRMCSQHMAAYRRLLQLPNLHNKVYCQ